MPRLFVISLGVFVLAAGGWLIFRTMVSDDSSLTASGEFLQKSFPPELIFSRALWRPPTSQDRILHSARREWSDQQGVTRWQAFLAIEPSPALRDWLSTNPFSLASVPSTTRDIPNPPAWFPKKVQGYSIQQSPIGNMIILTSPDKSLVYLADQGLGFARATATPVPPSPQSHPANRLPNAPPPNPSVSTYKQSDLYTDSHLN